MSNNPIDQEEITKQVANDIYQAVTNQLKFQTSRTVGASNKAVILDLITNRLNAFQITSVALDRIEQDDAITSFLQDMGAKVEIDEYFHISLQGTQEKAAPTLKDAFRLWVFEVVMSRQGAPRRHQYKLKSNYQFPNAVWFEHDKIITGWVTNVVGNKPLYGVVRYFIGGDQIGWVESESAFGQDKEAAIAWCRETMKTLAEEQSK